MKRILIPLLAVAVTMPLSCGNVAAQVYKCTNAAGQTEYSDSECGDDSKLVEVENKTRQKRRAKPPFTCPSGILAVINNLHYPSMDDVDEAILRAESDLTNQRYRRAIMRVDPARKFPDQVSEVRAEAFPAAEVPGFSNGVVLNVRICK